MAKYVKKHMCLAVILRNMTRLDHDELAVVQSVSGSLRRAHLKLIEAKQFIQKSSEPKQLELPTAAAEDRVS